MTRFLALALLVPTLLSAQTAADTTPRTITVDEAVRLARRNSPLAVQARGQLRMARAGIKSAYFAFIPTASLSLGSNWRRGLEFDPQEERIITASSLSFSNGLGMRVDLFDGGRRFFNLRAARSQRDAADAADIAQQFQVALDVKQQYYDVLAAREAEQAARAQLAEAEQQLRVSTVRVSAGAASRSDSLRSVVTVGNARLAILDAENRVQLANASLTRLVGTSFPVTAAPEDETITELPPEMLDTERLLTLARQGPIVQQAEAQRSAARALSRSALTSFLPTVSANAQRGGTGFDRRFGLEDPYNYSSGFQVGLSFPLLNGFAREENVIRADVAADNAEAQLRDAHLRAQQELTQALGLFRNAGQRVAVQLVSVAATEEDLRLQQQRYALGAASVLDVLTSQSALNQARNALITARFDQRVARARLEALVGRTIAPER